jgi:hypothetical protein
MFRLFLLFALFPLLGASAWFSQLADDYAAIAQGGGTVDIGGGVLALEVILRGGNLRGALQPTLT